MKTILMGLLIFVTAISQAQAEACLTIESHDRKFFQAALISPKLEDAYRIEIMQLDRDSITHGQMRVQFQDYAGKTKVVAIKLKQDCQTAKIVEK